MNLVEDLTHRPPAPELSANGYTEHPDKIAIAPFTYSSRLEEDGQAVPSRLTLLAYDSAVHIANDAKEAGLEPHIVIAGEQSRRDVAAFTGDILVDQYPTIHPTTSLRDRSNRLLNTTLQVEAIDEWRQNAAPDIGRVVVVGWGFHLWRIRRNFDSRHIVTDIEQTYRVEDVIDELYRQPNYRDDFKQRYGFNREWPRIINSVAYDLEQSEKLVRILHEIGNGALLKAVSATLDQGRYHDITPDGLFINEASEKPSLSGLARRFYAAGGDERTEFGLPR